MAKIKHSKIHSIIWKAKIPQDIKEKALASIKRLEKEYPKGADDETFGWGCDYLAGSFVYSQTKEGFEFWNDVERRIGQR